MPGSRVDPVQHKPADRVLPTPYGAAKPFNVLTNI
jgi:hypothetical protein